MRIVAIVQSRLGSSRLPGKALLTLGGKPMLAHVLERAHAIRDVDSVVLATSDSLRDESLIPVASASGTPVWVGSEWDVLGRMHDAAKACNADVIMRLTGDCPFLAPEVCDEVIGAFRSTECDYMSNDTSRSGFPDGMDCEVFSMHALAMATVHATNRQDREHVTPWIRRMLRCGLYLCADGDYSARKLSVDTPENYQYAKEVHRHLAPLAFSLTDTLTACERADVGVRQWTTSSEGVNGGNGSL